MLVWQSFQVSYRYPHLFVPQFHQQNRNVRGEYIVKLEPVSGSWAPMSSTYRSVPFATESEARDDANRIWLFVRDVWEGYVSADKNRDVAFVPGNDNRSICPSCHHYDTVKLTFHAYQDVWECMTDSCTYGGSRSIGD